MCVCIAGTLR